MNNIVDFLNGIGGMVGIVAGILLGMLVIGGLAQAINSIKDWLEDEHPDAYNLLTSFGGMSIVVGGGWCFIRYIL